MGRHRSDAGIGSPARVGEKHRATTEAQMEVGDRTPARAHPWSPADYSVDVARMQKRVRLSNESQRLLDRVAPEHAVGESPDTKRARGNVQMDSADVVSVAMLHSDGSSLTSANLMEEEDQCIMK